MPEEINWKEIPGTMESVAVLVFSEDNSKVLLVKHTEEAQNEEGRYGLPAGKIELSESPKEAAVRELMEETGLNATEESLEQYEGNYFGSYIIRTKGQVLRHAHMKVYHCNAYEGALKDDKKTIPEWVSVEQIKKWAAEDEEKDKEMKKLELEGKLDIENEELWRHRKLMPNVSIAINNYLESIKPTNET